jgi:hypothetical protein
MASINNLNRLRNTGYRMCRAVEVTVGGWPGECRAGGARGSALQLPQSGGDDQEWRDRMKLVRIEE